MVQSIVTSIAIMAASIISGLVLNKTLQKKFQMNQASVFILISISAMLILLFSFGYTILTVKGYIFSVLLLYASVSDIETMEVPDTIHIMIAITALIGITRVQVIPMILGFVLIPLPLIVASIIKKYSIGGADIKLMAASAFLLGFEKGLLALIIGLVLAIISIFIFRKIKRKETNSEFPLVPYLSIGCLIVYLL